MARYIFQGHFRDSQGNVVADGTVTVYDAGTTTPSTLYEADAGGTHVHTVTADSNGYFFFYIDTTDYPLMTEKFDITLSASGYTSQTYEDVAVYAGGTFDAWDKDYADLINAPDIDDLLPAQTTAANKVLKSDGSNASWTDSVDLVSVTTDALVLQLASAANGDMYYQASGTTARLGKGTARQGLQMNSGATAPEWADSPQSLMTEQGDILYASAANTLAALHHGTSGQYLKTQGDGANPTWADGSIPIGAADTKLFTNAGATAHEWALGVKRLATTRALNGSSEDVAYTGIGFKPSSIWVIMSNASAGSIFSHGFATSESSLCFYEYVIGSSRYMHTTTKLVYAIENTDVAQHAVLKTFDSDGFTLTWTKVGSPSAVTLNLYVLCYR